MKRLYHQEMALLTRFMLIASRFKTIAIESCTIIIAMHTLPYFMGFIRETKWVMYETHVSKNSKCYSNNKCVTNVE